jgi:hypothetical protein
LAAGLAEGYIQGSQIAEQRKEAEFSRRLRERQQALAEREAEARRLNEEEQRKARASAKLLEQHKQELGRRIQLAHSVGDTVQAAALYRQLQPLHERGQELLRHLGGGELKQYADGAQRLNDDLIRGRKHFDDLSPEQASQLVVFHTGHPVADLLDSEAGPSKVGQGLAQFRAGLGSLRSDGGRQLLDGVNTLWGHELDGLVGQHAWDGSIVTGAEFAAPVPHPDSPRHMLLTAKLTTRRGDGGVGTAYVPVTAERGQLLAHPEQSADAAVKTLGLDDLLHRYGELDTLHQVLNHDPAIRSKMIDSYLEGHDDTARRMLDWMHVLGRDPHEWTPRLKPAQLDFDGLAEPPSGAQDYSHLWGGQSDG